jgi:hypothetical protein
MIPATPSTLPQRPTLGARVRDLARNALRMMVVWAAIGALSGVLAAPQPRTPISIIAGVIAGLIVMTPVGALLGLFAARRAEVLIAALLGMGVGAAVAVYLGRSDVSVLANQGLILGGLFGSTLVPVFYRLPGWVKGLLGRQVS